MWSGFGPWPHSDLAESDPTFFFGNSLGRPPEARPWGFNSRCPVSQFRHHLPTDQRRWCLGWCLRTVGCWILNMDLAWSQHGTVRFCEILEIRLFTHRGQNTSRYVVANLSFQAETNWQNGMKTPWIYFRGSHIKEKLSIRCCTAGCTECHYTGKTSGIMRQKCLEEFFVTD